MVFANTGLYYVKLGIGDPETSADSCRNLIKIIEQKSKVKILSNRYNLLQTQLTENSLDIKDKWELEANIINEDIQWKSACKKFIELQILCGRNSNGKLWWDSSVLLLRLLLTKTNQIYVGGIVIILGTIPTSFGTAKRCGYSDRVKA